MKGNDESETVTITAGDPITIDSHSTPEIKDPQELEKIAKEGLEELDDAVGTDDLKQWTYMGVKFPIYFQDPHWIQYNGTFMLAVDPAFVTMPMKANWLAKYAPELMKLGHQILEKNLHIKIKTH